MEWGREVHEIAVMFYSAVMLYSAVQKEPPALSASFILMMWAGDTRAVWANDSNICNVSWQIAARAAAYRSSTLADI